MTQAELADTLGKDKPAPTVEQAIAEGLANTLAELQTYNDAWGEGVRD